MTVREELGIARHSRRGMLIAAPLEFDSASVAGQADSFVRAVRATRLEVDFSETRFIDSDAVNFLLLLRRHAASVTCYNAGPRVQRVFSMLKIGAELPLKQQQNIREMYF